MFYNENVYYLLCSSTNAIFGKNLVLEIQAKMLSANQIAWFLNELFLQSKSSKPGLWTLKFTVSHEWTDRINRFFACWYKLMQVKRLLKILGIGMAKNGCGQSCDEALKLTVSEEWIDGINWFFECWYRFTKIKSWSKIYWVGMVKNGCCQSGHGTLKLTASQNWTEGINWFFECWYKFSKAKS